MYGQNWYSGTVKSFKTFMLRSYYVPQKHDHNHGFKIPAPPRSLKSSKVGADVTLTGRLFLKRSFDGKKDPSCIDGSINWQTQFLCLHVFITLSLSLCLSLSLSLPQPLFPLFGHFSVLFIFTFSYLFSKLINIIIMYL